MALVNLPSSISSIRGSLPGIVFRSVAGKTVASLRPSHVSRSSDFQVASISAFNAAVSAWRNLSEQDRSAWASSARYWNRWIVDRADRRLTPRQLFISRYLDFQPLTYSMAALIPVVLPVEHITALSLSASPSGIFLSVTKAIGLPVYVGIPSAARAFRLGPIWRPCWRRLPKINLFGVGVVVVNITTSFTAALGVPAPGETIAIKMHATTLSSYPSPSYFTECIFSS